MTNFSEINITTSATTTNAAKTTNTTTTTETYVENSINSDSGSTSDIDKFSTINNYNNNNNYHQEYDYDDDYDNYNDGVQEPFLVKKKNYKNNSPKQTYKQKRQQLRQWAQFRRHPQKHLAGIRRPLYCLLLILMMVLALVYFPLYTTVQSRYGSHPDWANTTSRNISEYLFPDYNTTWLEPHGACREKVFLIIIVCSRVQNFAARQRIRETWGNVTEFNYDMFEKMHSHLRGQYLEPLKSRIQYYSDYLQQPAHTANTERSWSTKIGLGMNNNNNSDNLEAYLDSTMKIPMRVLFLVGLTKENSHDKGKVMHNNETINQLHSELMKYNDIIQENFIDTYANLTIKSVYALKWITQRCLHQSAFFMKCDDDTFVNVPNLLHYLLGGTLPIYNDTLDLFDVRTVNTLAQHNRLNATQDYLAGYLFCTSRPVADRASKWYMPAYMFPGDIYPPYLSGAGYIMSNDVVSRLYATSLNTTLVYLEDVYVTGMLAQRLHLLRIHQPLFGYNRSEKFCHFKGTITEHLIKDDFMFDAYAFVSNVSSTCPPPGYIFRMRLHKNTKCL